MRKDHCDGCWRLDSPLRSRRTSTNRTIPRSPMRSPAPWSPHDQSDPARCAFPVLSVLHLPLQRLRPLQPARPDRDRDYGHFGSLAHLSRPATPTSISSQAATPLGARSSHESAGGPVARERCEKADGPCDGRRSCPARWPRSGSWPSNPAAKDKALAPHRRLQSQPALARPGRPARGHALVGNRLEQPGRRAEPHEQSIHVPPFDR